jgi:uncharacterized protein (TIGR03067 family)
MGKTPISISTLQGTWNVVMLEVEGRTMPFAGAQIVVKGDRFTSLGMGATYAGKLVVDDSQTPCAIDMRFTAGPEKGNINRGIFEFQGDKWRLCLQMTGKDRPKKFATAPGSGLALETLERVQPGAAPSPKVKAAKSQPNAASPPATPAHEPVPELEGEWAMVSCVTSGQPLDEQFVKHGKRVAKGNNITVSMMGRVMMKARFTVDHSTQPNRIDYALSGGQEQQGIYELEGEMLKVNFSSPGQDRPADFSSSAGDGRTLTVWRLVKR